MQALSRPLSFKRGRREAQRFGQWLEEAIRRKVAREEKGGG